MKKLRPTTPGQRQRIIADYSMLTKKEPEKSLIFGFKRRKGRAKSGEITVRHKDGDKRYILAGKGMKVGDAVITSENADMTEGNRLPVHKIPVGFFVYNIELQPGKGGQIARTAGSYAKVMAHESGRTQLAMPSSETRIVSSQCLATIGTVSNAEHNLVSFGKAGASRWRGIRPTVRGSAMNPVDHPHGGGQGRQSIGLPYPKTPWGKHALGKKTRKRKNPTGKFIVKRRSKK